MGKKAMALAVELEAVQAQLHTVQGVAENRQRRISALETEVRRVITARDENRMQMRTHENLQRALTTLLALPTNATGEEILNRIKALVPKPLADWERELLAGVDPEQEKAKADAESAWKFVESTNHRKAIGLHSYLVVLALTDQQAKWSREAERVAEGMAVHEAVEHFTTLVNPHAPVTNARVTKHIYQTLPQRGVGFIIDIRHDS